MTLESNALRVLVASANEKDGGAAVAASRLRDGLLAQGHNALMFVQTPGTGHPATLGPKGQIQRTVARLRSDLDAIPLKRYPKRHAPFSVNWLPRFYPAWPSHWNADIVHLHWVNAGFMSLGDIKQIQQPVVWTLHDMWPLTGGCHYDEECGRYELGCGSCPVLYSAEKNDISARRWTAKRDAYSDVDMTLVSPSRWLAKCASQSPLLGKKRIEVIRNGLDLRKYKPLDKAFARQAVGLPADKPIILFGAVNASGDPRKGHGLLQTAMMRLNADARIDPPVLAVFGSSPPRQESTFGFTTFHFGHLGDDISLALLYAACDVFVAPSLQDNLPNTVAEALACGTPCVAFNVGGMPDMITHQENGYLAKAFDPVDLAEGLAWTLLQLKRQPQMLAHAARKFAVEQLDLETQTRCYIELYRELIERRKATP